MATIFDRIRQKAGQVLQGAGNLIDRDPSIQGVQLAKGGLFNRISNTPFTDARGVQTTVGQRAREVAQDVTQNPNRYNVFSFMRERGLGTNTPLDRPVQAVGNTVPAKFLESRVINPLLQAPGNIKTAFDPNQSKLRRTVAGLTAGAAFLPGVDDAVVAGIQALQERAAGTNKDVLSTNYEPTPLGDILRNRGRDGAAATALDIAELPLLLGTVLTTGKGADALIKRADEVAGGAKALEQGARSIDDVLGGARETQNVLRLPRRPAGTMYVTPEGTAIKVSRQPKTTMALDQILKDADEAINPVDKKVIETTTKALPAGKTPLAIGEGDKVRQAAEAAEAALRQPPKAGVQGISKTPLARLWDDLARSSKGVIERAGNAGKAIRQRLELADEEGALAAGQQVDDMYAAVRGLSKQEKATLADVIEGNAQPISEAQANAARVWGDISADIYKRAKEQGLDIGFIEKYFPHNILKGDTAEARAMMSRAASRRFGNLELTRQTDLPYDKDPSVLLGYIESANKRIAEAKHFGAADEVLYNLANQVGKEGGDSAQVTRYIDQILGKEQAGTLKDVSEKIRSAETILKLNFGTSLTNLTQNLSTMLRTDVPSTVGAIKKTITNPQVAFSNARRAGEIGVDEARVLEDYAGTGNTVTSWLRAIGMLGAEKVNRVVSVNAFMDYAAKLGRQASEGNQAAIRELKRLGLTDDEIAKGLSEFDTLKVGRRGSKATQFSTAPGELPYAWHTPIGKVLTQFKSFAYKQTGLLASEAKRISQETKAGNFKPLANAMITYGVAAPIVGEVVNDIKALITNKQRDSKFLSVERYVDNILGATSLGLLDSTEGLFGKYGTGGVVSAVAGPFASDLYKAAETVSGATSGDKYEQRKAARNVVGSIPLVGKTLSNTLIPNSFVTNILGGTNVGLGDKDKETYRNLQQSDPQAAEAFRERQMQSRKEEPGLIDKILGRQSAITVPQKGATAEEKKAFNQSVQDMLEAGGVPDAEVLKAYVTKGKDPKSKSIEERTDAYKSTKSLVDNEYYSDDQKAAILEASGIDKNNYDYYELASKDQDVRLQELLPKLDNMDTGTMVEFLMQGRRAVAGKQLVSNAMVDYLYENDYIGENEQKAIKALKYDEINDKFYFSKSFKGGGSGMTYKQARALFKTEIPQFSSLKNLNSLLGKFAQTSAKDDTLIENILQGAPTTRQRSSGLWF